MKKWHQKSSIIICTSPDDVTLFSKVSLQAAFLRHQVTMDEQQRQVNEARSLKSTHVSRLAFSDVADPMGFNAFTTNSGKVPSSTLLKHAIRQ